MIQYAPIAIIALLFGVVALLGLIDRRKQRNRLDELPPLSFIVPCYNDAASVGETIASIFEAYGPDADVIVADDGSTDGSRELLAELRSRYGFSLVLNERNSGKSKTLNDQFDRAKHDIVVLVDADLIVNRRSLTDAITRLQNPSVGAVSCPYAPQNTGVIPLMQHIEYNMLSFIQGAYNCFSAVALWGGFIVIRKQAFLDVGRFTLNAITEDMDLAFKLNEAGWRVEQSFHPVRTYVPDTLRKWYRQKLRWSSGGFQCFLKHYRVWVKNPLHLVFITSYCVLLTLAVVDLARDVVLWDRILANLDSPGAGRASGLGLWLASLGPDGPMLADLLWRLSFTALSLPFVLPLATSLRRAHLWLLVVPFSILYVPVFTVMSVLGAAYFLRRRKELVAASRAW